MLVFIIGLPLKNVIYDGNVPYWDTSLEHPGTYASWIIVNTASGGDTLWQALHSNPEFVSDFELAYETESYKLYHNRYGVKPIPDPSLSRKR